ncbi:MAG: DUF934 domain-containing protein [Rhodospirillales bacterium]
MVLIKDGAIADDPYVAFEGAQSIDPGQAVSVSLADWQADREAIRAQDAPVALRLPNDAAMEDIAGDLPEFAAIIVEFPTFSDGRAFSQARQLREQFGYQGEIRAVGHVIRDQYLFLHRCGVNAIEVADEKALAAWNTAMNEFSLFYQRTVDRRTPVSALRGRVSGSVS